MKEVVRQTEGKSWKEVEMELNRINDVNNRKF